ncbi:MAG: DUF1573 domain-containing protein [Acidobacteria bacterium]|nr:DUF1573 domain-containing protein [Acidobacteriota bacterium]
MRRRQWIVVSSVLAMGVAVVAAQTRGTSPAKVAPSLHVDHEVLDVGQVLAGQDVVGTFVFTNTGKRPIRILRAAPS